MSEQDDFIDIAVYNTVFTRRNGKLEIFDSTELEEVILCPRQIQELKKFIEDNF